jgi:hypothetical protein
MVRGTGGSVSCGRGVGSGRRLTSHGLPIASASEECAVLVVEGHG